MSTPQPVVRERLPHPALRPFVDRFWVRSAVDGGPQRILPDGCVDLLIDLAAGRALAVGTMTRAQVLEGRPWPIAAVRFRPGAAHPFLGLAADELTDRVAESGALGMAWLTGLARRGEEDPLVAVGALEDALLARLAAVPSPDPLVAHAVASLLGPQPPAVDALALRLGCTRQHLRRILRRRVGVSGKMLARVGRLQRAVARLQSPRGTLAEIAADLGYFDQAHMARDFRALAGVCPAVARKGGGSIFPIRSLFERA
jgi:AraC-like DNA-binding protein